MKNQSKFRTKVVIVPNGYKGYWGIVFPKGTTWYSTKITRLNEQDARADAKKEIEKQQMDRMAQGMVDNLNRNVLLEQPN